MRFQVMHRGRGGVAVEHVAPCPARMAASRPPSLPPAASQRMPEHMRMEAADAGDLGPAAKGEVQGVVAEAATAVPEPQRRVSARRCWRRNLR